MAAFLKNLPSVNKANFSKFQNDAYKYPLKKQSLFACNKDQDESVIINQSYNLLIQYLEKQSSNYTSNDRNKKRDVNETSNSNAHEIFDSSSSKKRRMNHGEDMQA